MQIAEIDDGTPAMRGHAAQSMFSRAASARNVSPTVSLPGGPPSGPAKLARAPRCAMATEALAALHQAGFADAVHVGGGVLAWAREVDPSLPTY